MSGPFYGGPGRPLRLLNIVLGLVAVLIAAALMKTWVAPAAQIPSPAVTKPLQEAEALAYHPTARPPLAQFEVLLEKNPFKQPPPMPAQAVNAPPPPPLPTLVGTILVDHERRAILSDKGKANIYAMGQEVAGGVITEIREDRIAFKRGDATREIMLKAAIESAASVSAKTSAPSAPVADAPGASVRPSGPGQPPAATSQIGGYPSLPTVPGGVSSEEESRRRREERVKGR